MIAKVAALAILLSVAGSLTALYMLQSRKLGALQRQAKFRACLISSSISLTIVLGISQLWAAPRWLEAPPGGGAAASLAHGIGQLAQVGILASAALAIASRLSFRPTGHPQPARYFAIWVPYLIAWCMAAAFGAVAGVSREAIIAILGLLPTAILVPDANGTRSVQRTVVLWLRAIVTFSLIVSLFSYAWSYSPWQVWPGGWRGTSDRLSGLTPQPNVLGWIAVLSLVVETTQVRVSRGHAWLVFALISLATLLLTGSRSALISGLLALAVYELTRVGGSRSIFSGLRLFLVTCGGVVAIFSFLTRGDSASFNGRNLTWQQAWEAFVANPVLGSGPGAYAYDLTTVSVPYAHNQVLQTLAETGAVGGVALLVHVLSLISSATRARVSNPAAMPLVTAWLSIGLTENLLRFTAAEFTLSLVLFAGALSAALFGVIPTIDAVPEVIRSESESGLGSTSAEREARYGM